MLEQHEIALPNGIWKVLKKGDEICIVDNLGRSRHQSCGHLETAIHLAMFLGRNELTPHENADAALRSMVENFLKDTEQNHETLLLPK